MRAGSTPQGDWVGEFTHPALLDVAPEPAAEVTTPETRLRWEGVAGWLAASHVLARRRISSTKYIQQDAHLAALSRAVIEAETDAAVLRDALDHIRSARAYAVPKGMRDGHARTLRIDWLHNRLQRLASDARRRAAPAPAQRELPLGHLSPPRGRPAP